MGTFDTAGEVIFAEDNQSANQLIERAPSMGSGLFQTSPAVSLLVTLLHRPPRLSSSRYII
jgi:hypothetical protein